jgi:hypothetical protein
MHLYVHVAADSLDESRESLVGWGAICDTHTLECAICLVSASLVTALFRHNKDSHANCVVRDIIENICDKGYPCS